MHNRQCRLAGLLLAVSGAVSNAAETGHRVLSLTLADLVSDPAALQVGSALSTDEILEWQMYVPADYDPSRPSGLLVYISPTRSGDIPRSWRQVLDRHNVIWIAADRSGNSELVARRLILALLATSAARKHYAIDAERIYISGHRNPDAHDFEEALLYLDSRIQPRQQTF
ncbi:MAG: hypothetical protein WDZ50_06120 [Woeseia sp.]